VIQTAGSSLHAWVSPARKGLRSSPRKSLPGKEKCGFSPVAPRKPNSGPKHMRFDGLAQALWRPSAMNPCRKLAARRAAAAKVVGREAGHQQDAGAQQQHVGPPQAVSPKENLEPAQPGGGRLDRQDADLFADLLGRPRDGQHGQAADVLEVALPVPGLGVRKGPSARAAPGASSRSDSRGGTSRVGRVMALILGDASEREAGPWASS
jgi:hypothetical protein